MNKDSKVDMAASWFVTLRFQVLMDICLTPPSKQRYSVTDEKVTWHSKTPDLWEVFGNRRKRFLKLYLKGEEVTQTI